MATMPALHTTIRPGARAAAVMTALAVLGGTIGTATAATAVPRLGGAGTTAVAAVIPTSVPDRVFLQPGETHHPEAGFESGRENRLPPMCGHRFASDASVAVSRTLTMIFRDPTTPPVNIPDGVLAQTVSVYHGVAAKRFMNQVRAAVAACPEQTVQGRKVQYRTLAPVAVGDDSIMIEERYQTPASPDDDELIWLTDRISAVRVGDAVTVLNATGYEGANVSATTMASFTRAAHRRLADWA